MTGAIVACWLGPPCSTWSIAREHGLLLDDDGPRPVRSMECPFGLSALSLKEFAEVCMGNTLLFFTGALFAISCFLGCICMIEHPAVPEWYQRRQTACIWRTGLLRTLLQLPGASSVQIFQGYYGAASPKPTMFAISNCKECADIFGAHRTHPLPPAIKMGKKSDAGYATAALKEYPAQLAKCMALIGLEWIKRNDPVAIQRIHGECQRCNHQRFGVHDEIEKHRRFLKEAQKELESLSDVERQLEQVQSETVQLRAQLRVEEEEAKQIEAMTLTKKAWLDDLFPSFIGKMAELVETEEKLEKQTENLHQVEKQRDQVRADVAAAEEEEAKILASVEQLRHDQVAGVGMHRNLETELQMLNTEANNLRGELALLKTEKVEAEQRLQLVMPALQEVRRKVKELECQVEAAHGELSHEKDLGERLERETDVCQDTVRSLRDENVRLSEQCTKLEAQLMQVSRVVVPLTPASRVRAHRSCSEATPLRSPAGQRRTPVSARAARRSGGKQEENGTRTPSKLQYLSDFIRKEEGKLSGDL
eukprot:symbB.v1.2.029063.t1/scaffold3144.1/size62492/3